MHTELWLAGLLITSMFFFFLNLQTVTGKDQKIQGKERTGDGMIWYLGTISVDEQDL